VDINVYNDFDEFENYLILSSLGGLGHMIGMVLREVGIKWNPKGLWLNGTSPLLLGPVKAIQLTSKRRDILSFLGLDEETWLKGFQKDVDAFEWICQCKFTQLKAVHEKFNSFNTVERENVRRFVQYLVSTSKRMDDLDLKQFHQEITKKFNKDKEIQDIVTRQARERDCRMKFSGTIVSQETGLDGKELGSFIKFIKESRPKDLTFQEFILDHVTDIKEFLDQKLMEWKLSRLGVKDP
jgi:hypothetical protein